MAKQSAKRPAATGTSCVSSTATTALTEAIGIVKEAATAEVR
jgi:hypothetical protein